MRFKVGDKARLNITKLKKNYNKCSEFLNWLILNKDTVFTITYATDNIFSLEYKTDTLMFFKNEILPVIPYRKIIKEILNESKNY